ncbi:MAG: hypothetical protein EBY23_03895 [Actinobacteria bacterium]|nr:hypothetical protein [Actinomycetota bacterium]
MWVGLTAVVLASCGGGSNSATKDTAGSTSTERARNTLVGGFGTDGAGYSDVALGKSNSSWYGQLTSHDNGDGTTNVAVLLQGSKNGVPVLQVLLSRIGKDGAFDTSYGDGGFTYITLDPEHWVSTMMFDSHNNVVVAIGWDTEVPGEKDADGYQVYVSHSELRAYNFATGQAQNDYGTNGVLADLETTLGSEVYEVSLGLRGTKADSFNFMTSDGLVQLAADGTQIKFAQMEPKHGNMYSRLIDMSYLRFSFAGLLGNYWDDEGNRLGMEYSLLHPTIPAKSIQGSTDDLSMLDGWDMKQYAVPSAKHPLPNIMVITNDDHQVDRGELDTGTNAFLNIDHFSFNENDDNYFRGATIAPTGTTLVGLENKYAGQQNLITCNVALASVCETGAAQRLALPGASFREGSVSNVRIETDGTIRSLVEKRNSDGVGTDAVVSLGADGIPSTSPVEPYLSSLSTQPAIEGNGWITDDYKKIGANSAVMVAGEMETAPAIGIISSSAGVRSVKQNKKPKRAFPTGKYVWTDTWGGNLQFDEKGSEYVDAGDMNGAVGYARILPADGQIDKSYGENGLASLGSRKDCVESWSQVAPNGQLMVLQIQREKLQTDCDYKAKATVISTVIISPEGEVTSTVFSKPLPWDDQQQLIISPLTQEFYFYSQQWIQDAGAQDSGKTEYSILRYNAQGELDQAFGTAGKLIFSDDSILAWPLSPLAADNKGRLLFAGTSSDGANDVLRVARITRDGKLDMGVDAPPPPVHTPEEKREAHEEQKQLEANPAQPVADAAVITPISITAVITAGDGKVKVTWVDAMKYATPPTYTVTATPGGKSCTSTTTTCNIAGLDAWQSYTFAVSTSGKVAATSAPSAEVKPERVAKVGSKTSLRKLLTPAGKTTVKWATTGGCKISGTSFVAADKPGTCLLTAKNAKVGKAASTVRFVRVQVVAATKK